MLKLSLKCVKNGDPKVASIHVGLLWCGSNPPASAGDLQVRSLEKEIATHSIIIFFFFPLHYSCMGNNMDRGAWQAAVNGTVKELDMT